MENENWIVKLAQIWKQCVRT